MNRQFSQVDDELLLSKFLTPFRQGYIQIEDYLFPEHFQQFANSIDEFVVHNDDLWVCSFPKTGTTWTQEMVWMINNHFDFNRGQINIMERFPFLEVSMLFDFYPVMEKNKDFNPPECFLNSIEYANNIQGPRFIKTHLPWMFLPKQIRNGEKTPKIIYVMRNPKDTCVSYYYHCKHIEGFKGNFEEFAQLFLTGKVTYGPFWKNVLSFWNQRHRQNILYLTYEELKTDLSTAIVKVSRFLGKTLTDEQIELLTKHLSFESMKQNSSLNYEGVLEMNRNFNFTEEKGQFMRSGKVGSYKAEMSPEMMGKFDSWTKENLKGIDSSFFDIIL